MCIRDSIYVVQDSKVIIEHISGLADLSNEVPNTIKTKFASASAGKVFVAVAILQLIERGKLNFKDTLGELLDIDLHDIDADVTVEQLLNHTSGVPDYFDESIMDEYEELWFEYPNYRIRHNNDLFPLFIKKPMILSLIHIWLRQHQPPRGPRPGLRLCRRDRRRLSALRQKRGRAHLGGAARGAAPDVSGNPAVSRT